MKLIFGNFRIMFIKPIDNVFFIKKKNKKIVATY